MYNLPSSYASSATTTTSTITTAATSTSASRQGDANRGPQLRSASASTSLLDAQHGSATSSGYVPPGRERIVAAFDAGSHAELRAMLEAAVAQSDVETLQLMVEAEIPVSGDWSSHRKLLNDVLNARDAAGDTLLMRVLKTRPVDRRERRNRSLLLSQLVCLGADVRMHDKQGRTGAMTAIRLGYSARDIESLVRDDVIDHADDSGETLLMVAVTMQKEALVELLLARGASPTAQPQQGRDSALQLAWSDADYGNDSIRGMLLAAAPQALASEAALCNATAWTPEQQAFHAVRAGNRTALERLLKSHPELTEARTDAGHALMMLAAIHGRLDLAKLLLDKGARVNAATASRDTALLYAIRHGHSHLANWLIDKGADVSHRNRHGHVPLARAAAKGMASVVARLLEHGADAERVSNDGSLLEIAFDSGSRETVQTVLAHLGASAQGRNDLNNALYLTGYESMMRPDNKYMARMQMLLDAGADADTVTFNGDGKTTLLMFLARQTNEKMPNGVRVAELLIERGATLELVDGQGLTALEIARQNGYQPMIDLLSGKVSASSKA
jgi:ankyrin repeat protein